MLYQLDGLLVRTYKGTKYLSATRDEFTLTVIDDIGDVVQATQPIDTDINLHQCSVRALTCFVHASKVLATSTNLGDCTRCGTTQVFDKCQHRYSARVDIKHEENTRTAIVFTRVVRCF